MSKEFKFDKLHEMKLHTFEHQNLQEGKIFFSINHQINLCFDFEFF